MTPYMIGALIGAFIVSGLVSRGMLKAFKKVENVVVRIFLAQFSTLVIAVALNSFGASNSANFSFSRILFKFSVVVFVWTIIDLLRINKLKKSGPESTEKVPVEAEKQAS